MTARNLVDIGSGPSSACSVRGTKFRSLASDHALGHQVHEVEASHLRFQLPCQAAPGLEARPEGTHPALQGRAVDGIIVDGHPLRTALLQAPEPAAPSRPGPFSRRSSHAPFGHRTTATGRLAPPMDSQVSSTPVTTAGPPAGRVPGWGPLPARSVTMRRHPPCSPAQRPAAGARRCRGRSCIANVGFEADRGR